MTGGSSPYLGIPIQPPPEVTPSRLMPGSRIGTPVRFHDRPHESPHDTPQQVFAETGPHPAPHEYPHETPHELTPVPMGRSRCQNP